MKRFWAVLLAQVFLTPSLFALCVLAPGADLRQAPSPDSDLLIKAIPYTPLQKLAKKNGWYRVKDVDGKIYWAREERLTSSFQCVVIKNEFANLRKGPGTRFPKAGAGMGEKYLSFRLIEDKKEWVKVEDLDGDESWIKKENLWIQ